MLLGREQNAEAGAGDVVEPREIDDRAIGELQEDLARSLGFGGVETACQNDGLILDFDLEHVS